MNQARADRLRRRGEHPKDQRLFAAGENALLAPVRAHVEREVAVRRGQPVRLLVSPRRLHTDVKRQRTVGTLLEALVLGWSRYYSVLFDR